MENLKLKIAEALIEIKVKGMTINKYHGFPNKFTELPTITYTMISDNSQYAFNNSIKGYSGSFQIDIWADKYSDISKILLELKRKMLEKGIFYEGGNELIDPSGIKRFTTTFVIKK